MSLLQTIWTYALVIRDLLVATSFLAIANLLPPLRPARKNLTGQTAIVTGANSGVGYGIALDLARQGATVILACRSDKKAAKARQDIISSCPSAKVDIVLLDVSSFDSVRLFAKACKEKYARIDILVHNAGISVPPVGQDFTHDGFEIMYQTNFLSSFLLTHLLEFHLSETARIVFTTSLGSYSGRINDKFSLSKVADEVENNFHAFGFGQKPVAKYGQDKLMQAAFAKKLQAYFDTRPGNRKMAFSFMPGLVKTNIFDALRDPFWEDPMFWTLSKAVHITGIELDQGAATALHLAVSDEKYVVANRGRYFDRMKPRMHLVSLLHRET